MDPPKKVFKFNSVAKFKYAMWGEEALDDKERSTLLSILVVWLRRFSMKATLRVSIDVLSSLVVSLNCAILIITLILSTSVYSNRGFTSMVS